ncbi:663_t:CDS:2, partial [Entrophospora sp. SA101]
MSSQTNRPGENLNQSPKKRKILTKIQKRELCEKKRDNPNIKGIDLAQEYGISVQSVSDILRQSSQWLNYDESSPSNAYQESENDQVPDINIFDAINFISNAWNQVTVETIKSSWNKTKIINYNSSVAEDSNQESEINEINDLINELPFTDHLNADEFITIDQNLVVQEEMTDDEIVKI